MKYRIKIITFVSGRIGYYAQVKRSWGWYDLDYQGSEYLKMPLECDTRGDAIKRIDINYSGNKKVKSIEFEYITKNQEK